jgi:hypothetical protein
MKFRRRLEFLSKIFHSFHHPAEIFPCVRKLIVTREELPFSGLSQESKKDM